MLTVNGGRFNKKEASSAIQRKRVVCSFPNRQHFALLCREVSIEELDTNPRMEINRQQG